MILCKSHNIIRRIIVGEKLSNANFQALRTIKQREIQHIPGHQAHTNGKGQDYNRINNKAKQAQNEPR